MRKVVHALILQQFKCLISTDNTTQSHVNQFQFPSHHFPIKGNVLGHILCFILNAQHSTLRQLLHPSAFTLFLHFFLSAQAFIEQLTKEQRQDRNEDMHGWQHSFKAAYKTLILLPIIDLITTYSINLEAESRTVKYCSWTGFTRLQTAPAQ